MRKQLEISMIVCITMVALGSTTLATPREVLNWSRAIGLESNVAGLKLLPFYVLGVGELAGHLHGTCIYLNRQETPPQERVTLEVQSDGEELWAIVVLQVGNDTKGPWETIGSSAGTGPIIKLKIDSDASSPQLKVDLEAYRPFIEKFRFGRIVLKDGESAIFELSELRRPHEGA